MQKIIFSIFIIFLALFLSPSLYALDGAMLAKYSKVKLPFTDEEKEWMKNHPIIKYTGDPNWLPFEAFNDKGEYIGIVSDTLKLIDVMLPIQIDVIPSKSWEQSVKMAENKEVDVLSETTDSRLTSFLTFTKPYIQNPVVIVMKNSDGYIDDVSKIKNKKIALIKDYGYNDKIKQKYSSISFYEVNNIQEGLLGVSTGEFDALIADLGLSSYSISTMGINNVNIVGKTEFTTQIGFGIRKDYAIFVGIMNKAIGAIDENDKQKIMQKWNVQKLGNLVDYSLIWKIILGSIIIAIGMIYWNRTMAIEIRKRKIVEDELRVKNKHISDSINYASLIQNALLPSEESATHFFNDFFAIWSPKDVVGGDIYLFERMQNDSEALLFVIDCTGHGVPGAFVTILVKAIEQNIIAMLANGEKEVHPAEILQIFNRNIKSMLKQYAKDALSNVGFDGGVLYFDKSRDIIRFCGAETPLFYFNINDELITVKGDRHGVGYATSNADFVFTEHELKISEVKEIFMTTDGYIDQNGGAKSLPFGKKRFCEVLVANKEKPMRELKAVLLEELARWQVDEERNDDLSVVGVRV